MASENTIRHKLAEAINMAARYPKKSVGREILLDVIMYAASRAEVKVKIEGWEEKPPHESAGN